MSKRLCLLGAFIVGISTLLSSQQTLESTYFDLRAANDALYLPEKTDQYFTSGINLEIGKREKQTVPLRPGGSSTTERYWRLTQNIYTPREIYVEEFQADDRPFASYLVVTRGKSTVDDQLGLAVGWELTAGILGRYSGGGRVQNAWHSILSYADEVPGWPNEVKPDVLLNYQVRVSQRFTPAPRLDFTAGLTGRLGTLYTNLSPDLKLSWLALRLGKRNRLSFDLLGNGRLVAYDATLSGGLLNRDDRYRGKVRPKRMVWTFGLDGTIELGRLKLSSGIRHLSAEFYGGFSHAWAWFSVGVQPGD